ncbi:hypothetical protein [Streptomyces mirabilis]
MSELPPEDALSADDDGNVAHPVPIDSSSAQEGDSGTPADLFPPALGG